MTLTTCPFSIKKCAKMSVKKLQKFISGWGLCPQVCHSLCQILRAQLLLDIRQNALNSKILKFSGGDSPDLFKKKASISPEIPVTEVRKSWFAEPETSPNGSPTVKVALQEPKTVTQLRFFKLR